MLCLIIQPSAEKSLGKDQVRLHVVAQKKGLSFSKRKIGSSRWTYANKGNSSAMKALEQISSSDNKTDLKLALTKLINEDSVKVPTVEEA